MRCLECHNHELIYKECRELIGGVRVWFYFCPGCEAELIAKREPFTPLPVVVQLQPEKDDPDTPLPGVIVKDIDLLATNPDPQGRFWRTGGQRAGEVIVLTLPAATGTQEEDYTED